MSGSQISSNSQLGSKKSQGANENNYQKLNKQSTMLYLHHHNHHQFQNQLNSSSSNNFVQSQTLLNSSNPHYTNEVLQEQKNNQSFVSQNQKTGSSETVLGQR